MSFYEIVSSGSIDQGDIISPVVMKNYLPWWPEKESRPLVVMTPTCDLAQEKAEFHRLCLLQPFPHLLYLLGKEINLSKDEWEGKVALSKIKTNRITDKLKNAVKNAWPRYHFLPSESGVFKTDYIIDFEIVVTIPLGDLSSMKRHARLTSPYKQELVQRLTSHLMRIGTPDVSISQIDSIVSGCINSSGIRIS